MTNKRIIIVLSIFAVIACFLLVSSLVFKIKTIDVVFATEQTSISSDNIVKSSRIKKGGSIFFVNKNKAKFSIEKSEPYAKCTLIESKFPNKIVININLREEEFFVKFENETDIKYLIVDNDLKILRVEETKPSGLCELVNINANSTNKGEFLDNGLAKSVSTYFNLYNFNAQKVKERLTSITFKDNDITIKTIDNTIIIKNYLEKLQAKIQLALSAYSQVDDGQGGFKYNDKDFTINNNCEVTQSNNG